MLVGVVALLFGVVGLTTTTTTTIVMMAYPHQRDKPVGWHPLYGRGGGRGGGQERAGGVGRAGGEWGGQGLCLLRRRLGFDEGRDGWMDG